MNGNYQLGDVVFGNWVIKEKIGEGSFGKVYGIERSDFGHTYKAALKVITVPQNEAELQMALDEGMDEEDLTQHFYSAVEEIVQEFYLMSKVKGSSHVVGYEDHTVIPHTQGIGWDILIRMERLTPLLTWAFAHPMSRRDIIQLGIHLCSALELCQKHQILHRDIKPENIFVSDSGDYKLGDFGVARTMEKTMSGMSKKGTYNYMAPEVYKGEEYGFRADMYSVGIVLYRLLNHNRIPFLPPAPERVTMRDRENALNRRIQGEELPLPMFAQDELGRIVCKAAAPVPADRFESPTQMRKVLEDALLRENDDTPIYPDAKDQKKRQEASRSVDRSVNMSATPNMSTVREKERQTVEEILSEDVTEKTASAFALRSNIAKREVEIPDKPQQSLEEDDDKTISAFDSPKEKINVSGKEQAKKRPESKTASQEKPKKKSMLPLLAIAAVIIVGVIAVIGIGGGKSSSDQGGNSSAQNQENIQEQVMELTLSDYIEFWWGDFYNELTLPNHSTLDYTSSSYWDVENALKAAGFVRVDALSYYFLNEEYGNRLYVEDVGSSVRELYIESWEGATAAMTYYEAQEAGMVDSVLPTTLRLGQTTAAELGFSEEVLSWFDKDWGVYKKLDDTWHVLALLDEYDGEKSLSVSIENLNNTTEAVDMAFKQTDRGWVLSWISVSMEKK